MRRAAAGSRTQTCFVDSRGCLSNTEGMKWQNKVNLSPPSSSPNHSSISLIKDTPGCLVGINLKWQSGSASRPGMETFLVLIKGRHSVYAPAWHGSEGHLIRNQQAFSSLGRRVGMCIPSLATVVSLFRRIQQANRSFRLPRSIEQRPTIPLAHTRFAAFSCHSLRLHMGSVSLCTGILPWPL